MFRIVPLFLAALSLAACEGAPGASDEVDDDLASHRAHFDGEIVLTLPEREGNAPYGWSFAAEALVPARHADLVLSSFDCGARGRWVSLVGLAQVCAPDEDGGVPDAESCGAFGVEVGGSDPEVALDEVFYVWPQDSDVPVPLVVLARTDTPFDWYEQEDLSFEVVLGVASE